MKTYSQILLTSALLFCLITCFAQNQPSRLISGILNDSSGSPLPGVSIIIKNSNTGVITDINGYYEIEAPVGSTLMFSFIGLKTKELVVLPESGVDSGSKEKIKTFHHTIPDNPEKTLSPYFLIKSDYPETDRLPLKNTSVISQISGSMANIKVRQLYVNDGKSTLEATYIFPGSTKAAVHGMSMQIGNRILHAKIKEKEKARKTYTAAIAAGKTATLLEQKRPNVFQMNVGNILPGDSIMVELKYTEILQPIAGEYQFVFPTVVGPRYANPGSIQEAREVEWTQNPNLKEGTLSPSGFDFNLYLNGGIPIKRIRSLSHKLDIQYNGQASAIVKLQKPVEANRDIIINYQLSSKQIESGLLLHEGKDENFFLWLMEPPQRPKADYSPPKEFIFIIDVSGSMYGTPLNLAKKVMSELITDLRPIDKFNVMLFESSSEMMAKQSLTATKDNLAKAQQFIDQQRGGGGTNLYPALVKALDLGKDKGYESRTFIVLTDGYVTVEKKAFNLIREHSNEANLFALGIGSSVNRYLLEGMAKAGNGEMFVINNEREAVKTGKKLIGYIQKPVITDIKLSVTGAYLYDI